MAQDRMVNGIRFLWLMILAVALSTLPGFYIPTDLYGRVSTLLGTWILTLAGLLIGELLIEHILYRVMLWKRFSPHPLAVGLSISCVPFVGWCFSYRVAFLATNPSVAIFMALASGIIIGFAIGIIDGTVNADTNHPSMSDPGTTDPSTTRPRSNGQAANDNDSNRKQKRDLFQQSCG